MRFVSARPGYVFMWLRLGCPAVLLRECAAAASLFINFYYYYYYYYYYEEVFDATTPFWKCIF